MGLFKFKEQHELFPGPGIIIERSGRLFIGLHFIVHKKGYTKRFFELDFGDSSIVDLPLYWLRCSWRRPKYFGWKHMFKIFGGTSSCKNIGYNDHWAMA